MSIVISNDFKNYNLKQMQSLAKDIRSEIISVVTQNGGHLSANLGVVELTLALHRVFDFPKDKLLFDVGHQSYTHKILSGRAENFSTLRQKNGLSGFCDPQESEYDAFIAGHSGNSIAAAIGLCKARDAVGGNEKIIAVIGDASLSNGLALEALFSSEYKPKNLVIILNDNGMSIGKNSSALYSAVSKMTAKKRYRSFNSFLNKVFKSTSAFGRYLRRVKRNIKKRLNKNSFFERCGFKYIGALDGHNLSELSTVFTDIKHYDRPVFVHIVTNKGKGMDLAEKDPSTYHGIGAHLQVSQSTFANSVSQILEKYYSKDNKIIAVCAAMKDGVGLADFAKNHPNRFVDAGICESSAVTISAGMAKGGLKPVVFIYSTFLQRAYDQIVHDVCLLNLPVVFMVDRAGLTGADGKTHQGMLDITFLRSIPNLKVFSPKDEKELDAMLGYALSLNCPVAIRYPNGKINTVGIENYDFSNNLWENIKNDGDIIVLASGARAVCRAISAREKSQVKFSIVNARTVVPLDSKLLDGISDKKIITFEEGYAQGGFGSAVAEYYAQKGKNVNLKIVGAPTVIIPHATANEQAQMLNVDENALITAVLEMNN